MSPRSQRERYLLVGLAVVALLVLAYSLLVAQTILAGVGFVVPLAFLYLFWRLVRAHERIADAREASVRSRGWGDDADGEP